ncbi:MAG: acetyl-CoA acetyltransferase [Halioglobus sp.]
MSTARRIPDGHPIIVGTGQHTWREPSAERTPLDALQAAAATALADCGVADMHAAIDTIATIRFIADTNPGTRDLFPRDPGAELARRLGIRNAARYLSTIGGNTPQYLVNHFARRLAAGEVGAVLLSGAELIRSLFGALRSGEDISGWAGARAEEPPTLGREREGLSETEMRHGLYEPINTYPLFENSLQRHLGRNRAEHHALLAELCAGMSRVAASNPLAWRTDALSAQEIGTVARHNRYIGYPYTRAMNAVLEVDMSAALVMTTAGRARELGIDPQRWIYLRGGADANDIWYPIERATLHSSPAIALCWQSLAQHSGIGLDDISHFDLYSCFPSAVEVACEAIGLAPLDPRGVTVTGGLPFFGGPGNNYSLHAIAQTVDVLREAGNGHALVTANGFYLTKHSLGLYSTEPAGDLRAPIDGGALQARIDQGPRVVPAADPAGPATVETYTVAFDRNGPKQGIVFARNAAGERLVANTPDDPQSLQHLLAEDPVGHAGHVHCDEGRNIFTL